LKATDRFYVEGVFCHLEGQALRVANLGPGGLFAVARKGLPHLNDTVLLDIQLRSRVPFRVMAEVSWVNDPEDPASPDVPPGFGVRFTRITKEDGKAIEDLLRHADRVVRKPLRK
jgi:PilZ domain-containing protein